MKLGFDVDGVFCDFNSAYIAKIIAVTGRDTFPPRPFAITTWSYPEDLYGYSKAQIATVWNVIKSERNFWVRLEPFHGERVVQVLDRLHTRQAHGDQIYFITSRPGYKAKLQTEEWLKGMGMPHPTVLLSSEKGLCAQALELDAYIDDRTENLMMVRVQRPSCKVYRVLRPWNEYVPGTTPVYSAYEMLDDLE